MAPVNINDTGEWHHLVAHMVFDENGSKSAKYASNK